VSIRARIFFVFVTAVIAGFALLAHWISRDVSDRYSESFEEVMVDSANLLAEIITTDLNSTAASNSNTANLNNSTYKKLGESLQRLQLRKFSAHIYELEKTQVDIRIYVTDAKGIVIFDSDQGNAVGEDYSEWRDVHLTLKGQYGARATKVNGIASTGDPSRTLTIAYVAAPVYQHGKIIGSVTLAKPKNNIDRFVANAKTNLTKAVLISVVIALLLGLMLYTWVSQPLQTLVNYANAVGRGERVPLPQLGNNEIGRVGDAIEHMRQSLEDKQYVEHYVQSLTHEIKSPLTAIHSAAELLARDLPAEKREQFANTILKETDRLSDFASQLLQLAALEKRQQIEKTNHISVKELVNDVVESHTLECNANQLDVTFNLANDLKISCDKFLIRQAIDNLLRNAIEFSPKNGKIIITVEQHSQFVSLKIHDNGPGIPEFAKERIFERFYSLPRPETGLKSSGLGLNFALEVAQLHGGSLTLKNCHSGTCAHLQLPFNSH